MTKFGKVLRKKREAAKITQGELGVKLGLTSPQYVSNCERGLCPMSPERMKIAAALLSVRPEVFLQAAVDDYRARIREKMGL